MSQILDQGGLAAQLALGMALIGLLLIVLACWWWRKNQDPAAAALAAVDAGQSRGASALEQYKLGRNAALKAAQPTSAFLLIAGILAWALVFVVMGVMGFSRAPDPLLVTDVLRGARELSVPLSQGEFLDLVARSLLMGRLITLLAFPVILIAGLALIYLRGCLLGRTLDQALLQVVEKVDPAGEVPQLQEIARDLVGPSGQGRLYQ